MKWRLDILVVCCLCLAMNGWSIASEISTLSLKVHPTQYQSIQRLLPSDYPISVQEAKFNGHPIVIKEMETRGKSSANFRRKSYSIELDQSFNFQHSGQNIKLKRFYLLNMAMDQHYFHNCLAFLCLRDLKICDLYFQYVLLNINNQCEGLYFLVQRPYDFALKDQKSPLVLRRLDSYSIDKAKAGKKVDSDFVKSCKKLFREIAVSCKKLEGEELYNSLNSKLDLQAYFDWLAFNYWIRNGDYTDEVYYYVLPDQQPVRFGIIPWDFDDILSYDPHEGKEARDKILGDKLIFSSEDILDRTIAMDPILYKKYCTRLGIVAGILGAETTLKTNLDYIQNSLSPYFNLRCVSEMSLLDANPTNAEQMKKQLVKTHSYLIRRSKDIKNKLKH